MSGERVRIVLVSDTHLSPLAPSLMANWRCVQQWIVARQTDAVVHLGDVTANGEHDATELGSAAAVFSAMPLPMRLLPGNHDIGDVPTAATLRAWSLAVGDEAWVMGAGPWRLLGLNAQALQPGAAAETRLAHWLDRALAGHRGPLGLLLHKPLLAIGPRAAGRYVDEVVAATLLATLKTRDLRFVASGHTHQTLSRVVDGIEHRWVPSTAFVIPDAMQQRIGDKRAGVLSLELSGCGHRFEFHRPPGLVEHSLFDLESVYPQVVAARRALEDPS